MTEVVFRCDGNDRIGAGHVSRCVQIATALRMGGSEVTIVGHVEGVAAELVAAAGFAIEAPEAGVPAGLPRAAGGAVVDSYELPYAELAAAAELQPICAMIDDAELPPVQAVVSYHLDATSAIVPPPGVTAILGPAYAPVRPAVVAARRPRGLEHALVTLGGSGVERKLVDDLVAALLDLDERLEVFVAGVVEPTARDRVSCGFVRGGLTARIAEADIAVSGSGSTPYELACAGVPSVLIGVADNQIPVGQAFAAAGIALFADARTAASPAAPIRELGEAERRAEMAARGPAAIDGYGAFRTAAALRAVFAGRPLPRVITYRPATAADAAKLLAWRNDPDTREASRQRETVALDEHEAWLERVIADPARTLLVAEREGEPSGTVRFDREGDSSEIAVTVAPQARGAGVGTQMIREATELYLAAHDGVRVVRAEIRPSNTASLTAFARAGFARAGSAGDYEVLAADRRSVAAAGHE